MKKLTLFLATALAAAMLLTGCFGNMNPAPTAMPSAAPTATDAPAATDAPTASDDPAATDAPDASDAPAASDGLEVAPSPSASTAP